MDPDLMGYQVYRSTSSGFQLNKSNLLALSFDTSYTDGFVSPGQTYYYRIAGVDVHGNLGTPSSELSQTALSATLVSFAATSSRLSAFIHWTTATETNNYGFEIERRSVGKDGTPSPSWRRIGFVAGSGTSLSSRNYEYADRGIEAGTYDYRIKQIQTSGSYVYSTVAEVEIGLAPREFTLAQDYPNPFNPSTTLEFTLERDGRATVRIYNMLGQEVATVFDQEAEAGRVYQAQFNAGRLTSGVYVSILESGGKRLRQKMLLLK
jgi:hypothetical protein